MRTQQQNGFRNITGSNRGVNGRLTKSDVKMKMNAYNAKYEKYSEMPLEELQQMYIDNVVGGVYRMALIDAIQTKLNQPETETQTEEA